MCSDAKVREWREEAANGDHAAASNLLREFYGPIFAYLRRLSGNDTDAADLVQTTFIKVWNSLGQFRGLSSVSTWMHRIAYHTYLDWLRQDHHATQQSESWWENLPEESFGPLERTAQSDSARHLYAEVERLEEELRQAVHLHYYQGLSLSETAEVLQIPVSTLKYRLRNALDQLRSRLEKGELRHGSISVGDANRESGAMPQVTPRAADVSPSHLRQGEGAEGERVGVRGSLEDGSGSLSSRKPAPTRDSSPGTAVPGNTPHPNPLPSRRGEGDPPAGCPGTVRSGAQCAERSGDSLRRPLQL
ncbi:MAG: hypothetical protein C5B50_16830 [Verrucomicrobia bacterium]|nr:MAG: hypothetical protein C5B50_16830 [Verrucomicrobiota bacterium]